MIPGYSRPLYLLPFDHRHSYVAGMFKFVPPLAQGERDRVARSKQIIYGGFKQALAEGVAKERGCIVLGRGADETKVVGWLEAAASVPGFVGFAVGRTTFWDAIADFEGNLATRAEAVSRIARRYREWVNVFERAQEQH